MSSPSLRALSVGPPDESALDAITRYHAFLDAAYADNLGASKARRVSFFAKPTLADVRAAERRLGVTLPPSYVNFVTRHGLFSGPGDDAILLRPERLGTMYDRFMNDVFSGIETPEALADELGTDAAGVERLRKIVFFADGQYEETLELFRIDAANPRTGEAPLDGFDRDDYSAYAAMAAGYSGRSIDQHVANMVEFNVREVVKARKIDLSDG